MWKERGTSSTVITYDTAVYDPAPEVHIAGQDTVCPGQALSLTATVSRGGGAYSWSAGGGTSDVVNYTGQIPQSVHINYTWGGCIISDSIIPVAISTTVSITGNDPVCPGTSLLLHANATPPGGAFLWYPGGTTRADVTYTFPPPSTVNVYYAYARCLMGDSAIPVVDSLRLALHSVGQICLGESLTVSTSLVAAVSPQHHWSTGQTGSSITTTPISSGWWVVTDSVTDTYHCFARATDSLLVHPAPVAGIGADKTFICADGGYIHFSDSSALPGSNPSRDSIISYAWYQAGTLLASVPDIYSHFSALGTFQISHYVTTSYGCISDSSISVRVLPAPVTHISASTGTTSICSGTSIVLSDTLASGYHYAWSTGTDTTYMISLTGLQAGSKDYSLTVHNDYGCADTASITLVVRPSPAAPQIQAPDSVFCQNTANNVFVAINPDQGQAYTWSTSAGLTIGSTQRYLCYINMPAYTATGYVTLTATTPDGCTASDSVRVYTSGDQAPVASVVYDANTLICTNNSYTYQWGYTSDTDMQDSILQGETQQAYILPTGGLVAGRYYWVMVSDGSCSNKVYYNAPMSIADEIVGEVQLYPVPCTDVLTIQTDEAISSVYIYSTLGALILSDPPHGGTKKIVVDTRPLAEGIYHLIVVYGDDRRGFHTIAKN